MDSGDQTMAPAVSPEAVVATPLPDVSDILFVLLICLIIFSLPNYVLGDGSTGWHLVTGKYILDHGQIPQQDLFSYTFPTRAWVPYEWFSDLLGALLVKIGGIKLLAVASATCIAALFALMYRQCRRYGAHFIVAATLTVLGILISSVHWLARPHLLGFLFLFIFCTHLEQFRRGAESSRRMILWLAITMVLWSNAHPGFLVGLAATFIYLFSEAMIAFVSQGETRENSMLKARAFATALGIVFACTLINPNAAHLYSYIASYLHSSVVLAATDEYLPPNFHDLHAILMAVLFAIFVFALAITRRKAAAAQILMILAFAWLALNSRRNEPLFVIASVPLIADLLSEVDFSRLTGAQIFTPSHWLGVLKEKWNLYGGIVDEVEGTCTMHILPIALTALLVLSCFFGGRLGPIELVSSRFDNDTKPSQTLDYLRSHNMDFNRGFNLDNWGGYIAYMTGKRVFIDDRLDFYGEPFFMQYGEIVQAKPGWQALLDKENIEWILFPKDSTLEHALQKDSGWSLLASDSAAVLYGRNPVK